LLSHTERLKTDAAAQKANGDAYYALAQSVGFDYDRLLSDPRAKRLVEQGQRLFAKANPWETVGAQIAAAVFVIGSYLLAREVQVSQPKRQAARETARERALEVGSANARPTVHR